MIENCRDFRRLQVFFAKAVTFGHQHTRMAQHVRQCVSCAREVQAIREAEAFFLRKPAKEERRLRSLLLARTENKR
ncbi:MAG: hypothetical protein A2751_02195 [Candidatus Doudnabacteria bacterium RIFCSPHIGHO2_01_FULL_46_14]|uniref:Zinc-finger domain-containing protein n=1 Tax=Candidatus Doudnabacteria bacterium RIFCSPHIGHO2_01_FULL_46_14 TaxID=1817824 RepID=A0A1F5NJF6_9BACT|nr:MAG: hypothetical protein A2751_02195 [Candidatus Doudnabacteria bacterium RIFCSPHIGHO2_01_FULL_46_14]